MTHNNVIWPHLQENWYEKVNHFSQQTSWLHGPMKFYAVDGVVLFAVLLLVSWWLARRTGDLLRVAAALWAPVGVVIAVGVNQIISHAVAEPRPYTVLPHALVLVHRSHDYSFPSDHAVMAGAVAAGVLLVNRRLGVVTTLLALLLAFARVYVGAHFPLDVVAGLLVGAAVCLVSYLIVRPLVRWLVGLLARTPLRILLTAEPAHADRASEPSTSPASPRTDA